jgi:hypothetical protein
MQKQIFKGIIGGWLALALMLVFVPPVWAIDKEVAENPLLFYRGSAKPAVIEEVTCAVGFVHNRISNSTVTKAGGEDNFTVLIGDDALELPSMRWQSPSIYASSNDYLYFSSLRIGQGTKLVHLSSDTSPGITVTSSNTDPSVIGHFNGYFWLSDNSPTVGPDDYIGIGVHTRTYAWSETYRDDFIIYDFYIKNLNAVTLEDMYVAMHSDCDISASAGGSGTQGFWRDDKPGYYRDDATGEFISYMYDSDNPTIAGDDAGGKFLPKESTGYVGTRLLYCPPAVGSSDTSVQQGHGWWDWNSDPGSDEDWMALMTDGLWLDPPPSPHDFRYLQKLGPFDIAANDSIRVMFAYGVGEGLAGLRANLAWADSLFKLDWVGPSAPTAPEFALYPGDRQVLVGGSEPDSTWGTISETTPDPATGEVDFEGYRLWRKIGETGTWALLMECDLVNDIGHNTGLVHSYLDTDVSNGFQYGYVVTAFDRGEPENGIESFESGKGGFQTVEPGLDSPTARAGVTGIHVVPNPFVKSSPPGFGFDPTNNNPSEERILFVNLPDSAEATVTVYSLTGDKVIKLNKDWDLQAVSWDLITKSRQKLVAGVYLYVVESDKSGFEDFIGKFMVVR